eukprot:UN24511
MYETDYNYYYFKLAWYVLLFVATWALILSKNTILTLLGGCMLGFFWQQVAFAGHDFGHNAVTHKRSSDWWYSIYVTLFFGVSGQWWKRSHNVHHIFPNSIEWDPDIQHLPFLAIDERILAGIYSYYHEKVMPFDFASRIFIRLQHILFFPIMGLARYFMYLQSFLLVVNYKLNIYYRYSELMAIIGYFTWVGLLFSYIDGWGMRIAVSTIAHGYCGLLHLQITLSHWAMPAYNGVGYGVTKEHRDHFIEVQFETTTDIGCAPRDDWFHGGLQFQTAHHLFPRIPRHNLRKLKFDYLMEFCKKHNLAYVTSKGFCITVWEVILKMREQAMMVANGKHIDMKNSLLAQLVHESMDG